MKRGIKSLTDKRPRKKPRDDINHPEVQDSEELLRLMFSFLPPTSLANLSLVNKKFHDVAQDIDLWKSFIRKYYPQLEDTNPALYESDPKKLFTSKYTHDKERYAQGMHGMETELPLEILIDIFSKLDPKSLSNIRLVNFLFNSLSEDNQVWRVLLSKYFPYLEHQNKEQSNQSFKSLFINKFKKCQEFFYKYQHQSKLTPQPDQLADIKDLMEALRGNLKHIEEGSIHEDEKQLLYAFAAGNGHVDAWTRLKEDEGKNFWMNESLAIASGNGDLNVLQVLLEKIKQDKIKVELGTILFPAARIGHIEVVQWLLENYSEISDWDKGWALRSSALHGHLALVQWLLENYSEISFWLGLAFERAAKNGHFIVVQWLLEKYLVIPVRNIGFAFRIAAKECHLTVVQLLLENCPEISERDKGLALGNAAKNGHLALVQWLLENCPQIDEQYKSMAIQDAIRNEYYDVEKAIREYDGLKLQTESFALPITPYQTLIGNRTSNVNHSREMDEKEINTSERKFNL